MAELIDKPEKVVVMTEDLKLIVSNTKSHHRQKIGIAIELVTRTGKKIVLTPEHQLYTINGWLRAKELMMDCFIATPRKYDFGLSKKLEDYKIILLAYLITEGCMTGKSISISNSDVEIINEFKQALKQFDERIYLRHDTECNYNIYGHFTKAKANRHTLINYLKQLKLMGTDSGTKFVPDEIMMLDNECIALFLSRLYAGDGCIEKSSRITYTSKSETLIRQMQHLLLRFGVISSIYEKRKCATNTKNKIVRTYYELSVTSQEGILNFAEKIGIFPKDKRRKLQTLAGEVRNKRRNNNIDVIPNGVWVLTRPKSWADIGRSLGYSRPKDGRAFVNENATRQNFQVIANNNPDNDLMKRIAYSDVFWDKIKSVRVINEEFDICDLKTDHPNNNFVINDIIVRSS